jgi:integrase
MTRRVEKALTAALVRTVQEPGKYHDGGGLGLYLRVEKNSARFWIQRITIRGKRRELGLGSPPLVSLADARERATDNKRLVRAGGNPLKAKREAQMALTFSEAVEKYLAVKLAEFRNDKDRRQLRSTLDRYAAPILGMKLVAEIEMPDVLRVLLPIWSDKTVTASRLRGRIEAVLSWATVAGHRTGDNPAISKRRKWPAVAQADAPRWWHDLSRRDGMAARALQFATMTAARSGEVREMTWAEVDFKKALWNVPDVRMKMERPHRVPLTPEAVALLRGLPRMEGSEFVFFAPRGGALSDMSFSAVMRRMQEAEVKAGRTGYLDSESGRPAVPHGLRSTFRDWAAEHGFERDMAEIALSHDAGSDVERAYRRTDMLERRRGMMDSWGRFLRGEAGAKVVKLGTAKK